MMKKILILTGIVSAILLSACGKKCTCHHIGVYYNNTTTKYDTADYYEEIKIPLGDKCEEYSEHDANVAIDILCE